jgi:hypothetical protein
MILRGLDVCTELLLRAIFRSQTVISELYRRIPEMMISRIPFVFIQAPSILLVYVPVVKSCYPGVDSAWRLGRWKTKSPLAGIFPTMS